jgi:hypothetical protein
MSISTSAGIIVGLDGADFELTDEIYEMIDNDQLQTLSPYFDSSRKDRYIGIVVAGTGELTFTMDAVLEAKILFRKLTGLEPKVYLSAHVT